ncbi:MAG: hypothetical protein QME68_08150, partial [Elusimicrobiota bacterium]|nr:hypothetical protein [Elusimicrobiota bacterium]
CGFRAYKLQLIKKAFEIYGEKFIDKNGFCSTAGELIKIAKIESQLKVTEIPVILRYDLKKGKSKIKILKTIFGYLKLICREILASIITRNL